MLFIVGAQDWVNPSYHCTDMADALRRAGNQDVSVEIIDEVEHFFCQRHFPRIPLRRGHRGPALRWLDRYVKGA